ncbi:Mrp/NBP35 family ATP-binding protein [Parvicella tangerina]|uniref:Iron-sulfur cluster carrier protein n=1 Tax=Parvicella tangerina TaxID=2829795 RepID=A0A916JKR4_9FLAO|nr:Mrp/NBP35 family ATP-binding protein [Parvicella tangerina]CAG5079393.1 Iron-sulfur cluster carrier protein [Parvicella tangerina]
MKELTKESVLEALKKVVEPDLKKDIVSQDLVTDLQVGDKEVSFKVAVQNAAMHSRNRMQEACEFAIHRNFGKEVKVNCEVVAMKKAEANETKVKGIKNIIAVASGKGGVGKSTITANLALGLAQKGYKVGLVDADIYGPSQPLMFDVQHEKPKGKVVDGKQVIIPVESYGVKLLSIGFFADVNQAVIWRGPMATKALSQMVFDADWGELDYLLLDLPPGTGDIHLTLVQSLPITGAVIVSTPQNIALADARKGVSMFQLDSINVPVLGIVENMSWFTPAELPDNKYFIFGNEGAKHLAAQLEVPLLGQIPLVQSIRESGDVGRPAILQDTTPNAIAFKEMTDNVIEQIDLRNKTKAPTEVVKVEYGAPKCSS